MRKYVVVNIDSDEIITLWDSLEQAEQEIKDYDEDERDFYIVYEVTTKWVYQEPKVSILKSEKL